MNVERIPNRDADSISFSQSMARLFLVLADLKERLREKNPLTMTFYELRRLPQSKWEYGTWSVPCRRDDGEHHSRSEVAEARTRFGTFELVHEERIVTLDDVESLHFRDLVDLKPNWIPKIIERLPGIQNLFVGTKDMYRFGRNRRLTLREGMSTLHFRVC